MSAEETSEHPREQTPDGEPSSEAGEERRELEGLRAKESDYQDQLLRARAELENQRKRSAREVEDAHKYALQRFVRELLPVKDSLEKGLEAAATGPGEEVEGLQHGIRQTLRLWQEVLAREGLEEIYPLGQPFDPDYHEALSVRRSPGVAPNTVLEVVQKGYLLNGRLVRAARVIVAGGGDRDGAP